MAKGKVGRTVWLVAFTVLTLVIAGLFGAVVRQSWLTNSAAADIVTLEGQGAEMLHPMTTLVSELVVARSAAVRGNKVDPARLREAVDGVAEADAEYGVALQTTTRLAELTKKIDTAVSRNEVGREAFATYSGLVRLAVELELRIGDTSHLVHDPDLDSYYLMDAAIVRLPQAMVYAGEASDLVAIAGADGLQGDDALKAAVARFGVSAAAEAVTDGLNTSVEFTDRSALGGNIAERLDIFKAAAADFAPPNMLNPVGAPVVSDTMAANANRVFAAANPLAHRLLGELQALLDARADGLRSQWRFTAAAAGSAGLVGLALIWLLAVRRSRSGGADEPRSAQADDDLPVGSFAYARDLLDSEELVHVGRAVRSRGRGDAR